MVSRTNLHRFVDKARIHAAIAAAQRTTSAPIHVSIAPYFWGSVRRTAERAFRKHKLAHTSDRNGVLFFLVPSRREFVIIGDIGAHAALGQHVWDTTAAMLQDSFVRDEATSGLILGIETIARALSERFPCVPEQKSAS
jgi:uncharacterized membrane protein